MTHVNGTYKLLEEGLESVEVADSQEKTIKALPTPLKDVMFDQSLTTIVLLDLVKSLGLNDTTVLIIE